MFFVLSKILGYLFQPLVIIIVLLIGALVLKNARWKKRCLLLGVGLLLFLSNDFISNEVISAWELPAKPYKEIKQYEAAILLTGVTITQPSGPDDRIYFYIGADRVVHSAQLYHERKVKRIIVSGGSGKLIDNGYRESTEIKKSLMMMGIPDSVIYTDPNSDNTYENAVESKKILDQLSIKTKDCLLITSAFHMRRALACFRKVNAEMDYFTCDFRAHPRSFTPNVLFIPRLESIMIWQKLLKEWTGILAYKMMGYI